MRPLTNGFLAKVLCVLCLCFFCGWVRKGSGKTLTHDASASNVLAEKSRIDTEETRYVKLFLGTPPRAYRFRLSPECSRIYLYDVPEETSASFTFRPPRASNSSHVNADEDEGFEIGSGTEIFYFYTSSSGVSSSPPIRLDVRYGYPTPGSVCSEKMERPPPLSTPLIPHQGVMGLGDRSPLWRYWKSYSLSRRSLVLGEETPRDSMEEVRRHSLYRVGFAANLYPCEGSRNESFPFSLSYAKKCTSLPPSLVALMERKNQREYVARKKDLFLCHQLDGKPAARIAPLDLPPSCEEPAFLDPTLEEETLEEGAFALGELSLTRSVYWSDVSLKSYTLLPLAWPLNFEDLCEGGDERGESGEERREKEEDEENEGREKGEEGQEDPTRKGDVPRLCVAKNPPPSSPPFHFAHSDNSVWALVILVSLISWSLSFASVPPWSGKPSLLLACKMGISLSALCVLVLHRYAYGGDLLLSRLLSRESDVPHAVLFGCLCLCFIWDLALAASFFYLRGEKEFLPCNPKYEECHRVTFEPSVSVLVWLCSLEWRVDQEGSVVCTILSYLSCVFSCISFLRCVSRASPFPLLAISFLSSCATFYILFFWNVLSHTSEYATFGSSLDDASLATIWFSGVLLCSLTVYNALEPKRMVCALKRSLIRRGEPVSMQESPLGSQDLVAPPPGAEGIMSEAPLPPRFLPPPHNRIDVRSIRSVGVSVESTHLPLRGSAIPVPPSLALGTRAVIFSKRDTEII